MKFLKFVCFMFVATSAGENLCKERTAVTITSALL